MLCTGKLESRFGKQCCGGEIVNDTRTCCGNSTAGLAYQPDASRMCCGSEYIETATSVCCMTQEAKYKVTLFVFTQKYRTYSNIGTCTFEVDCVVIGV